MSKRKLEGGLEDAINMDVMMDNMTDVVGTLLLVLIIVQLKVNSTIDGIQSNLPQVTQEQVAELKEKAIEVKADAAQAQVQIKQQKSEEAKVAWDIQSRQATLKNHETTLAENKVTLLALDQLKQQLEQKKNEVELAKAEVSKLISERDNLRGLLDDTARAQIPPAKIVRMPSAREIPEGAELIRLLCASGKVYIVDTAFMKRKALEAVVKARNQLIRVPGPIKDGKDTSIYDHEKTAALLTKRELGNKLFKLEFPVIKTQDRIHMQIKPQPEAGETPEQFADSKSELARLLRVVKRNPKAVIWFLVCSDSFEAYLRAREECDEAGVPAGWELSGAPWLAENLYEFQTNVIAPPPPAPPPVPGAVSIPAPKKTLD